MLYYERYAKKKGYSIIIGLDEAGRGPLAGPLAVAAVYLKTTKFKHRVDDSKKLSASQRLKAFNEITAKSVFGVGFVSQETIDYFRITESLRFAADMALTQALSRLKHSLFKPNLKNTFLLFDGRLSSNLPYDSKEIIGGDGRSLSIAAASIVAKVSRDRIMDIYDKIYPNYGFSENKGYGTRRHLRDIRMFGLSPLHRRSFCGRISVG